MRHRKNTVKLGRLSQHRDLMLSNLVSDLIRHNRVTTTLAKAKAMRPLAEKMVTLGKKATLHHRRQAIAQLRQQDAVRKLFADLAPKYNEREGGYTRIIKLGPRHSDAAPMAIIEWVEGELKKSDKPKKTAAKTEAKKAPAKEEAPKAEEAEAPAAEAEVKEEAPAPEEPKAGGDVYPEDKADDKK